MKIAWAYANQILNRISSRFEHWFGLASVRLKPVPPLESKRALVAPTGLCLRHRGVGAVSYKVCNMKVTKES